MLAWSTLTLALGTEAGATTPNQEVTSKPGIAASAIVGTSGKARERLALVTASAVSLPLATCGNTRMTGENIAKAGALNRSV